MKRGSKPGSSSSQKETKSDLVKKTFLFEKNLDQHLKVAALVTGMEQSEIVREATITRLESMGCILDKPPVLPDLKRQ